MSARARVLRGMAVGSMSGTKSLFAWRVSRKTKFSPVCSSTASRKTSRGGLGRGCASLGNDGLDFVPMREAGIQFYFGRLAGKGEGEGSLDCFFIRIGFLGSADGEG